MKTVTFILVGIVAVVALVALVGALIPVGHTASRTFRFKASPEVVWEAISNPAEFRTWRSELKGVEILSTQPLKWIEVDSHNQRLTIEITEAKPPMRLVSTIADKNLPFGGSWLFELEPRNGGTELTITERGEVYNVFFRFMSRFVFGYTATIDRYGENLSRKLGE